MRKKNEANGQAKGSPWDKVPVKKGKLIGMLTDELANDTMPRSGDGGGSSPITSKSIGSPKVHKRLPSKFK